MDRPIRFRVWNKNTKQWIYGPNNEVNLFGEYILMGEFMNGVSIKELNDCIPLQYTGLKDKNGKEIYEGDIIIQNTFNEQKGWKMQVVFEEGSFKVNGKNLVFYSLGDYGVEIIGNIFDNPELIK